MNNERFIAYIEATFKNCLQLVKTKNKDYGATEDALANFRKSVNVGVAPERAILVRLSDKISRISTLLANEAEVSDETIDDTIHDAINYLAILRVIIWNERESTDSTHKFRVRSMKDVGDEIMKQDGPSNLSRP